jgi:hypothetical protein
MRDGGICQGGACLFVCLAVGTGAFGATGRLLLPRNPSINPHVIETEPVITVEVDLNPLTSEAVVFEVVVDTGTMEEVWGFEWQIGVDGNGLAFDTIASEALANAIAGMPTWEPRYLLFEDSAGFTAAESPKGIRAGDLSESTMGYDPANTSLGVFVIDIASEGAALGLHTLADPESFLFDIYLDREQIQLPAIQFLVVPEPSAALLLTLGLVGLRLRRRR